MTSPRQKEWERSERQIEKLGGSLALNCDSDVSKPRCARYIKYHWTNVECSNVHALVTYTNYVTGACTFCSSRWQRSESKTAFLVELYCE